MWETIFKGAIFKGGDFQGSAMAQTWETSASECREQIMPCGPPNQAFPPAQPSQPAPSSIP